MRRTLTTIVIGCAAAVLIPLAPAPATAVPAQDGGPGAKREWTQLARPDQKRLAAVVGDPIPNNAYCRRSLNRLELFRNSSKFEWPATLTILEETAPVDINNLDLFLGPYEDPSRRLWFRSLLWLSWRAALFAEKGQTAEATTAARAMLKAVNGYPDPGSSTPELLAFSNAVGWDEGTAFRRAEALLCLTAAVGVAEVEPALRMHAAALLDPNRYMGPPNRSVHNHGLLANLVLLDIADVLNDTGMRDAAVARMRSDYPQVFSQIGWSFESSSHYHGVNYLGWTEALFGLQARGFTADTAALESALARAADVSAHFIGPSGVPVMLGNSRGDDGFLRPRTVPSRPLTMVDPEAGVAFGRFSWTDANTTAWTAMNRPKRGAHGHNDRLSVTWETGGAPVLIDPGQPDYERTDPYTAWARSADAHNTSVPVTTKRDRTKLASLAVQRGDKTDQIEMTSTHSGFLQQREVLIDHKRRSLWVSDAAESAQAQHWHLAPEWTLDRIEGNVAYLGDTQGRILTVTTTPGAAISSYSGSTTPMAGWYATGFEEVIPATELIITGARQLDTLFVMGNGTPPEDVKVLSSTEPRSKKVKLEWSAPTPLQTVEPKLGANATKKQKRKARKKARKLALKQASAAVKIKGYRIQVKVDGGWTTVVNNTKSADTSAVLPGLANGTPYRFRVAALAKGTQTQFSRQSRKIIPFTTPGPVVLSAAASAGSAKKPKVKLDWLAPARDGGAPVTGYEIKLPGQGWKPLKRPRAKVLIPEKKAALVLRAVNKGGGGKTIKVKLKRKKDGTILVDGEVLVPPVPPTPPPTVTPTPTPEPSTEPDPDESTEPETVG